MHLLNIAVPTYNRSVNLKILNDTFFSKVLEECDGQVSVFVYDNSDNEVAEQNRRNLHPAVQYTRNAKNLGYAGNLLNCLQTRGSQWLWIISDDDEVHWPTFAEFIQWLSIIPEQGCDCVMLPFQNENGTQVNTAAHWGYQEGASTNLRNLLEHGQQLPFILFSTPVLRVQPERDLQQAAETYRGNDFIQIPLFSHYVGLNAPIRFYSKSLQTYRFSVNGRFPLLDLIESIEQLVDSLQQEFGFDLQRFKAHNYRGFLILYAKHRTGQCNIQHAAQAWGPLKRRFWSYPNLKNMVLIIVNCLPIPIARWCYRFMFGRPDGIGRA